MQFRPILIGSEIYRHSSFGPRHPLAVPRVSVALDLIRAMGWLDEAHYRTAPIAERGQVLRYHRADYVEALFQAERDQAVSPETQARYRIGVGDNPVYPEMYRRSMTGAGGLMLAARPEPGPARPGSRTASVAAPIMAVQTARRASAT